VAEFEGINNSATNIAAMAPISCARMNARTLAGAIPEKLLVNDLAIVTAGFAKDVDAVNQ
jgi:hypothetical protein